MGSKSQIQLSEQQLGSIRRCKLDSVGRRRGWDVSREKHQNMYIIYGETDHQPRLDAWDKCSGLMHWEDPEGSGREGWEGGLGCGIHINPWLIHVNVWQKPLKYCKVISLQLIKINEKKRRCKWERNKNSYEKETKIVFSLMGVKGWFLTWII